jgi:hypothetical protein
MIGAEFAAAAALVTDRHCQEVEQLATRVAALGGRLHDAQRTYSDTDDGSAAQIVAM